jgi:chromosome segregation ATPase
MHVESKESKVGEFSPADVRVSFENLVNLIDTNFRLLNLRFDDIYKRFDQIDIRFKEIDKRFEDIDKRFEQIEKRFEVIDKRFEQIDRRFEAIDKRFIELETKLEQRIDKQGDDIFDTINRMAGNIQTEMKAGFAKINEKLEDFSEFKDSTCYRLQHLEKSRFTDYSDIKQPSVSQSSVKEIYEEYKRRRQQKP